MFGDENDWQSSVVLFLMSVRRGSWDILSLFVGSDLGCLNPKA